MIQPNHHASPTFPTTRRIEASKQGRDVVVEGGHILVSRIEVCFGWKNIPGGLGSGGFFVDVLFLFISSYLLKGNKFGSICG